MGEQNDPNVKIIENATRDDVLAGDHIIWQEFETERGVTSITHREGIAHYSDSAGDWHTREGEHITTAEGEGITITIRRTVVDDQ